MLKSATALMQEGWDQMAKYIKLVVFAAALFATFSFGFDKAFSQVQGARIRVQTVQDELQADGSDVLTQHFEMQVLDATLASILAQFPITYNEASTEVSIVEAYTLKADGHKISIEPSGIITQQPPGNNALAAFFTDTKQKVLIFPNVEAGDTLVFTEKRHNKQLYFPGQFLREGVFGPGVAVDDSTLTIIAPKTLDLVTETHDLEFHKSQNGDNVVYTLHFSNPNPQPLQSSLISNMDRFPRYFVSTFKSYDELGRAYGALVRPKIEVTPKIKVQANGITAGINDRKEKARAIYEWVSQHVRYVAIEFGQGALVPHDADTVLANAYGDCKDHVVLLAALLKAVDIETVPVLINATNRYTVSKVPTINQFNHMIAWLPEFKIYADTTAKFLPFGTLALAEYGKPVLLAGPAEFGSRQIPVLSADPANITFKSVVTLDEERRATAETTTMASGAFAAQLRGLGSGIRAVGSERAASDMLSKQGKPLATGSFDVGVPDGFTPQYSISSKYSTPRPLNFTAMPVGLRLLPITGDLLIGPIGNTKLKDSDPTPCYNGHAAEELSLVLPAAAAVSSLPADTSINASQFQYTSHWSQSGQTVTVHRELITRLTEPVCSGDLRKEAAAALNSIRKDYEAPIPLAFGGGEHPTINLLAGQLSEVNSHSRRNQDRDWPITIKVTAPPTHGKVTVQTDQGLIRTSAGQPQSRAMTKVYYQSEPGYIGKDSFSYTRSTEDTSDPLNGRSYTINVQVK
jgi:hypothetical protein